MKKMLLTSIAALFLATGAAHAKCPFSYEPGGPIYGPWNLPEWWGTPIMCVNVNMSEMRAYGDCDCLYRKEMPLPRRRPKRALR